MRRQRGERKADKKRITRSSENGKEKEHLVRGERPVVLRDCNFQRSVCILAQRWLCYTTAFHIIQKKEV